MKPFRLFSAAALALPLAAASPTPSDGLQIRAACTREYLQAAADSYVAAQRAGNSSLAQAVTGGPMSYLENNKTTSAAKGILSKPLKIDLNRTIIDTTQCATYTEIIVSDPSNPYVIGSQIRWDSSGAAPVPAKMDILVSTKGDWLFNATGTLYYSSRENWDPIPEAQRDTRAAIKAAGDAYCDVFNDKSVKVPWGTPCNRLEGGQYIPGNSCNVGIPSNIVLKNRRYVVDEVLGVVDIFMDFAGGSPDSHEFRVEKGKLRYVHTITITGHH